MRNAEKQKVRSSEGGSGKRKELGSRNAEMGIGKNWEVGMRNAEKQKVRSSELGSGKLEG
jgi:hypothetical protein